MTYEDPDIIYSYTDQQAISDGFIHALSDKNRITNNAYVELTKKYDHYETNKELLDFIQFELNILFPYAVKKYNQGGILKTNFDFKVGNYKHSQILWLIPNENKGITIMKPEDY